jgi:hypothetical protein
MYIDRARENNDCADEVQQQFTPMLYYVGRAITVFLVYLETNVYENGLHPMST